MPVALSCAALFACHGSDPTQLIADGHRALGAANWDQARVNFEQAMRKLEPGDPMRFEAELGGVEARLADDPLEGTADFLALVERHPDQVGEQQFIRVAGLLASTEHFERANAVLTAGLQRFGVDSLGLRAAMLRALHETDLARPVTGMLPGFACWAEYGTHGR